MVTTEPAGISWADKIDLYISQVEPRNLRLAWPEAIPLLKLAEEHWEDYFDLQDLFVEIMAGRFQLWLVRDEK